MARHLKTAFFTLSILFMFACSEDDNSEINDSFVIEFETVCGWNIGHKLISIKKGEIKYNGQIISDETTPLSSEEWNELITCFDFNYLKTLDYNTCNICVDGCDEIIRIIGDKTENEIRYNPGDTIPGLENLQEKLREYTAEYYENN